MFAKFHESIFPPPTLYTPPSSLWLICLYYRINICYDNHQVLGVCPHIHIYYIYSNIAEYVLCMYEYKGEQVEHVNLNAIIRRL